MVSLVSTNDDLSMARLSINKYNLTFVTANFWASHAVSMMGDPDFSQIYLFDLESPLT